MLQTTPLFLSSTSCTEWDSPFAVISTAIVSADAGFQGDNGAVVGAEIRDGIQNIRDWCRHLYSSCGSIKNLLQQAKL
jgi:hypothetical protein